MKINTSLKHILIANSIFTGMSSATFILFSDVLAHLYLVDAFIIKIIGIGLIIFLVQLIWLLKSENSWIRIQWIIFQDLLWVFSSILLVFWNPLDVSIFANILILFVAMIVAVFAVLQWRYGRL